MLPKSHFSQPPALQEGDKVGIFLASSPVKEPYRSKGLQVLESLGLKPVEVVEPLGKVAGADFLARQPEASILDIQQFLDDFEIKALWAGRGGYGANLLLPYLEKLHLTHPKLIIGSSDVSYLLWGLMERFKLVVLYGPMVYASVAEEHFDAARLKQILFTPEIPFTMTGKTLKIGKCQGILTGGCLSNLVSLLGTPYFPVVEDRILLVEDVGERPYKLDRMFWQLSIAGVFQQIKGLILGQFPRCFAHEREKEDFLKRVNDYLTGCAIPVLYDLPFGHAETIHAIPLGRELTITTPHLQLS